MKMALTLVKISGYGFYDLVDEGVKSLNYICLEVAGSIPGTSTNFKCGLGLERGPPSLLRTIG